MYSSIATADQAVSIQIDAPIRTSTARDATIKERYIRWFIKSTSQLSDLKLEEPTLVPTLLEPTWLSDLQQSIRKSILPSNKLSENDGRWLNQEVANAATDFFSKTADLLPSKPFIYSSRNGDLVSELNIKNKPLTIIITPTFVVLFAMINGVPKERIITHSTQVRGEIEELIGQINNN